jgi:hypothetical protein
MITAVTIPSQASIARYGGVRSRALGNVPARRRLSPAELIGLAHGIPLRSTLHYVGLGAPVTGGAVMANQIATAGAATTVSLLVGLSVITGPVGAVVGGLIAIGSMVASLFGGCGQTCVQATSIANQVGGVMNQNVTQYLAAPIHYQSLQAAALNNFDTAWAALVQACSNPQLAAAGQRCISDRQRGSCKWKTSPGGWQQQSGKWVYVAPGPAGSGTTCWDWFVGNRDPIANDPTVVPDPPAATAAAASSTAAGTPAGASTDAAAPSSLTLLLIGGLLLLGVLL